MTRAAIARWAFATVVVLLALAAGYRALHQDVHPAAAISPAIKPSTTPAAETHPASETDQGFLYGRITTADGAIYEGRLRWGGDEEAFWGDYFNGSKHENPWLAQVPPERLPKESRPIEIFGITIAHRERPIDVSRLFMARLNGFALALVAPLHLLSWERGNGRPREKGGTYIRGSRTPGKSVPQKIFGSRSCPRLEDSRSELPEERGASTAWLATWAHLRQRANSGGQGVNQPTMGC